VDNLRNPDSAVAAGYGHFIYHGRPDPYFARNSYNSGAGTRYSRTEGPVGREIQWTREHLQWSGIGLFMSRTIIEKNMGGRLVVRNTGSGAEFRIET